MVTDTKENRNTHTHTHTQAQAERQIKRLAGRLTKGQKLIGKKQQCPSAQIIEHYADIPASAFCCFAKKHHLRHRYRLLEKYIFWIILIFLNWKHWRIKNYFTHFLFRKTGIKFSNASFSKVLTFTMSFKSKLEIFSFYHHFSPSFFLFILFCFNWAPPDCSTNANCSVWWDFLSWHTLLLLRVSQM